MTSVYALIVFDCARLLSCALDCARLQVALVSTEASANTAKLYGGSTSAATVDVQTDVFSVALPRPSVKGDVRTAAKPDDAIDCHVIAI